MKKAEVTVYLSLTFVLMITLIGALIESAAIQTMKNYKRADVNRSLECVFAEYQKELLDQYAVFALEGTYETGFYSENLMFDRLAYYGGENIKHSIERIQFLSDHNARGFYEQVLFYMKHRYGVNALQDKVGLTDLWKQQEEKAEIYEQTEQERVGQLDRLLNESGAQLLEEDNPIQYLDDMKKLSILELVMPNDKPVSEKNIALNETLSHRERQEGFGNFTDVEQESGTISALLFGQYLLDHFTTATDEGKGNALNYEIEYMIAGKQGDRENLNEVVKKLLLMRLVPNYVYLQTSNEKKAEAEALALTLSSVLAIPAITQAMAQVLLLFWAYGEAIMDLRTLLNGGKVPLTKTDESWQLSLSGLMKLKDTGQLQDGENATEGLKYKEYLRILLFLKNKEGIAMRALDIIEQNLRTVYGMDFFRADHCISKVEIKSECTLRRGITYQFSTFYGYN